MTMHDQEGGKNVCRPQTILKMIGDGMVAAEKRGSAFLTHTKHARKHQGEKHNRSKTSDLFIK